MRVCVTAAAALLSLHPSPHHKPLTHPLTPPSQGAIGDVYNFHLDPSLTLGCSSWGSTSVSTNVGPHHLLNVKSVTERRENMLWFRIPPKVLGLVDFGSRAVRVRYGLGWIGSVG